MDLDRTWLARGRSLATMLALVACSLATTGRASAQRVDVDADVDADADLGPVTEDVAAGRPTIFIGGAIGPAVNFDSDTGLKLEQSAGVRFASFDIGGNLAAHVFAGGLLQQTISSTSIYSFGARMGMDFELFRAEDFGINVTPLVSAGIAFLDLAGAQGGGFDTSLQLEAAAQAEVLFLDGALGIFARPLGFNYYVRDGAFTTYDFMFGVNGRI